MSEAEKTLGLAVCRSIVESHGGRLWMANNETTGAVVGRLHTSALGKSGARVRA